jgi:hypothetical protein
MNHTGGHPIVPSYMFDFSEGSMGVSPPYYKREKMYDN